MPSLRPVPRVAAVAAAALGVLAFLPRDAHAQSPADNQVMVHDLDPKTGLSVDAHERRLDYLSFGPILSLVGGYAHATGIGLEGSWMAYPTGRIPSFAYGAFAQAQLYDERYLRTAAGAEFAAGPAGVELGFAFRQTDGTYASTFATHTGFFLSIGYFYMAIRASAQLVAFPTNEPSFGLETALTLGLKLPIAIQGRDPTGAAIQADSHAW